ncbi:2-keto-3-deoxy-L-rhamnonate aldolase RhmA [Paracoccus alcaliphilus]|uniref:2-keto-3-deoxy-L-rhamnonate aldolase RhmA n=1 Tax=Paracoccus alcaliphilus TaxID=34002 RepID=A0A1H8KG39_9RHOB|nr:aldolase/citrate lyase family protein [Paracoccus alcaliphilus]WCR18917.1 hypothetical protein JHW40_04205 [Paracoccus alcaliphilus]SEN91943.1 2-keto-3-deoxy-L-rhamnonate aldolase RhmA [Paracoccus alcaliphilus]
MADQPEHQPDQVAGHAPGQRPDIRQIFVRRLRDRQPLAGSFVKSPDPAGIEILAGSGFDFAIVDAEHAAMGRAEIALLVMAGRAAGLPVLVRIPERGGHWIATALDAGAAGIVAPQVDSRAEAEALAQVMRFGMGGRGFSPSTAAAGYGRTGIAAHLAGQPQQTALICQIESAAGVQAAGAIAAVEGVDGLLLGPVDLAVSLGETDTGAAGVMQLCRDTIAAGTGQGCAAGLFLGDPATARGWLEQGASLLVLGSDQAFLRQSADRAMAGYRQALTAGGG